jgi:putative FmdB family regulatory protein
VPIYEYHCRKCGAGFELRRPLAEFDTPARCPTCHSRATTRKLSAFSFARGASASSGNEPAAGPGSGMGDDWDDADF